MKKMILIIVLFLGTSAFADASVNCVSRVGFVDNTGAQHVAVGPSVSGAYTTEKPIVGKIPGYDLQYFAVDEGNSTFDILMGDVGAVETQTAGTIKGDQVLIHILKNFADLKPKTCSIYFFAAVCAENVNLAEQTAAHWKFAQVDSKSVPVGCEVSGQ